MTHPDGAAFGAPFGAENRAAPAAPYPLAERPGGYGAPAPIVPQKPGPSGAPFGAPFGAPDGAPDAPVRDAQFVSWRLEEAGRTLLCLPGTGYSTRLRMSSLEIVRTAMEAYGWTPGRIRPPVPSGAAIDRMDEAYAWLKLIPEEKYVLRRILGARSLVHPLTDRHLFPWRRLAAALGADHKAVQRWWAQGVDLVVRGLGRG